MKKLFTLMTLLILMLVGGVNVAKAQVEIDGVWHYRLWVGDTEITLDNFDNIKSSSIKSGTVEFDPDTVKITLKNIVIEQAAACIRDAGSCPKEVIIVFEGNNTLKSSGGVAIDMQNSDVTFRGTGTVNVTGDMNLTSSNHKFQFVKSLKYNSSNSINFGDKAKVTVTKSELKADLRFGNATLEENSSLTSGNIYVKNGTLTLDNSTVTTPLIEGNAGILKVKKSEVKVEKNITGLNDLQLDGSEVTSPKGAYYDKSKKKMVDADGKELSSPAKIVISKKTETNPEDADKRTFTVSVTREVGLGYGVTNATVDFKSAEQFLGVKSMSDAKLYAIKMSTGEFVADAAATYDGWFNKEGDPQQWKDNPYCCVKFFEAIPYGKYTICDKGGDGGEKPEVGDKFTCQWALNANGKTAIFNINVIFVEKGFYRPEIVKTIEIGHVEKCTAPYCEEEPAPTFDVQEVCEALGTGDLSQAVAYIVNVTDGNFVANTTDGWRDINGDACPWSQADNGFCLKLDNPASGEFNYTGAHDANFEAGTSYLAQWGLVYDNKAVLLKVWVLFDPDPAGINTVNSDAKTQAPVYTIGGVRVKEATQKGVFIQNGHKFVVK